MNYPPTQKTLLERVQNGDEISWDEFYRRYTPIIRAAGKGAGFNDAECCDLVQAVMLKFFSSGATFVYREGKVKFRTWFARIIIPASSIRSAKRGNRKISMRNSPIRPIPSMKFSSKSGARPPSKRRKTNSAAASMKRPGRLSKCTVFRTATPNRSRSFSA